MKELVAFVARRNAPPFRRAWVGSIEGVRVSKRPIEIAKRVGYNPQTEWLRPIDQKLAAQVLAYAQSESMAHGEKRYRESLFREAKALLVELGADCQFWSNSDFSGWFAGDHPPNFWTYNSLSQSVFDTGVIGCSESHGFIYWVEEND